MLDLKQTIDSKEYIRTKFDKNEIVLYQNYAEIVLYDKFNDEKSRTIIDIEYVSKISSTKWYQRPDGYVATNNYNNKGYTYLHNVILEQTDSNFCCDHIDGNKLNNKIENLRVATYSQNNMNKKIYNNNTSGRVGVHWVKTKSKWCVMIGVEGRRINLGYFSEFEDAVKCRKDAEATHFKEFVPTESRASNNQKP